MVSIRLTKEARCALKFLADGLGISQAAVVELAIRDFNRDYADEAAVGSGGGRTFKKLRVETLGPRRFDLGTVYLSNRAKRALEEAKVTLNALLARYVAGDRGDQGKADKHMNDRRLKEGDELDGYYLLPTRRLIMIQTDPERVQTSVETYEELYG